MASKYVAFQHRHIGYYWGKAESLASTSWPGSQRTEPAQHSTGVVLNFKGSLRRHTDGTLFVFFENKNWTYYLGVLLKLLAVRNTL